MMRKFTSLNGNKRRKIDGSTTNSISGAFNTGSALSLISSLFPVEKFENKLPPIVMRHQLYALVKCRTEVDRCLNDMRKKGEIRLFKLGLNDEEMAVVYMKDYKEHVKKCCPNNVIVGNFINVVTECPDVSFSKSVLMKTYNIQEENISELIQQGVMTSRDIGCYWLSIPGVGEFVKTFKFGRRATLQYIRRTKYKELLQPELEQRKLPKKAKLPMLYHIYDIIGSDSVICMNTSTGTVLRLQVQN